MYAVIRAGGKQYRVAPGDVIKLERFSVPENGKVEFPAADILAVSPEAGQIVKPNGTAATVTGEVLGEGREKKILVFHFKRKKQYKKLQGHRQGYVSVRITGIGYGDKKESAPALERKQPKQQAKPAAPAPETEVAAKPAAKKKAATKPSAAKKAPAKKKAPTKKSGK